MILAKIRVNGVQALPVDVKHIPKGIIGGQIAFEYTDHMWDGLTKTVVFQGAVTKDVVNAGDLVTIPPEVVQRAVPSLHVGVYGTDAENNIAIPTLWADLGRIRAAADPSGDESTDESLPVWAQLQEQVDDLKKNGTGSVDESVIREIVDDYLQENPPAAGKDGQDGEDGEDGGYYTPAVTQPDSNTLQFAFTPSKADMPAVEPVQVALPGCGGNVDCLPEYSEADNGKVLGIVDGSPAWIEATVSGGGDTPDTPVVPTNHGIVWDLVNVTSNNNIASVTSGASLVAVLTPADGYTLGDVTVTMGGEVLTGAWNAETATVTIASVTGDVVISCAGIVMPEAVTVELPLLGRTQDDITSSSNVGVSYSDTVTKLSTGGQYPYWGGEVTTPCILHWEFPADAFTEGTYPQVRVALYDADEKFVGVWGGPSSGGTIAQFTYYDGTSGGFAKMDTGNSYDHVIDDVSIKYVLVAFRRGSAANDTVTSNATFATYMATVASASYTTGLPTAEEISVAEMVDNDYLQDYGVATLSLTTDVEDTTTFEGVLETAKNEWMTAYGGDMNKIPIIVHTDQHSYLARGKECGEVFDTISNMVNWYDISKVINLGDTINSFPDPNNLTAGSEGLENYLDAMSGVPFSKRIEIFGNHDVCYFEDATLTVIYHDQSYLQPYFRNILARKTSNNGYFVVKDDNFNVKYVAISGFEFDETWANKYVISSKQIDWLIAELSKADGYDVVLLSHVPVDGDAWGKADISAIVSARRDKTSGTITDAYGVSHNFDFSGCDGELVCSLHGHSHADVSGYNGNALYNVFSEFYASPRCLYFVLIDRTNRQLNIWKVDSTPQYQNFQVPLDKPTE